jgi:hypothetical protein
LKEPALDAGGEVAQVTHILTMAITDLDLGDREQADVVHHGVRHGKSLRTLIVQAALPVMT